MLTLEEAVQRVYGLGKRIVRTTETIQLPDNDIVIRENMTSEEKNIARTKIRDLVKDNTTEDTRTRLGIKGKFGMLVCYNGQHKAVYYKHPNLIDHSHTTKTCFNNNVLTVRLCDISDLTIEDQTVYAWHDSNGNVLFGQTVKTNDVRVVSDNVIVCDY